MRPVIDNAYLAAKAFNRIHSQRLHNIDVGENEEEKTFLAAMAKNFSTQYVTKKQVQCQKRNPKP